ncbi:MAG: F0F1 ATP synthase subunit delta [Candidatus Omnitrophota bacterium]|jgi:F0F1-type ATP synthase membrane subunit b/b'
MLIVSLIILQVFIFTGLVFSLRKILNRNVVSATSHLEQMSAEYAKKEEQVRKQLEDAQRQSKEIIADAQRDARQQRESMVNQMQAERDKVLNQANQKAEEIIQQADRTRQNLIADINKQIEEKALQQAVELVGQALPEHICREIHHYWLKEIISSSFEQLDRLHIPKDTQQARVVSAFALTPEQRDALKAKIKEKLGRAMELKEEIDSSVIAGLIVHIGSLVLDGSLRFKIKEAASARQASG